MEMQMDMYSFGELHDMPMKRLEKRIPGARPTKNKKKDSQIVQPSRQVRKMKKYANMLMKNEIVLMILYRLMLFWWIVSLVSWCYSKFDMFMFIPFDNMAGYNASDRYPNRHLDVPHRCKQVTHVFNASEVGGDVAYELDSSLVLLTELKGEGGRNILRYDQKTSESG